MHRPKIGILKKIYLTNKGHYRFYSPTYDRLGLGNIAKHKRPKMPMIDLELYPTIQTEKQLLKMIYDTFGEGEYRLTAYVKGHKGVWTFWKGQLNKDGFISERQKTEYAKNVDKIKEKIAKTKDEDELAWLEEEIQMEKEFKTSGRYGLCGYLKSSIRRGSLMLWNEPENSINTESWNKEIKIENKEESWGEIKKEEFATWQIKQ